MFYKQKLILIILLLFYQINNIFSDQLIKITNGTNPSFDGSFWGFRINEYKDITIRFFISDGIGKENRFDILQKTPPPHSHYKDIGYGTYLVKNGIIESFKVIKCDHKVKSILTNQKIELYYTDQDLLDDYYLLFNNSKIKLWGNSSYLVGQERMVGDVPVIIIENGGYTIENAKIRTYPSLGNNTVKYIDDNNKELNYVPKNTSVFIQARTKNRYQVGKWFNYWYLLESSIHFSKAAVDLGKTKYIWIFAEFVKYDEDIDQNFEKHYPTGYPYD